MHFVPSVPRHLEGLFFTISDLEVAMAWASVHPKVRLSVRADYRSVPEVIEIHQPGATTPRWRLWRDRAGRLHVDDWATGRFNLPYSTVSTALSHFATNLSDDVRGRTRS